MAPAAGEVRWQLKLAGAEDVKVFVFEGEGGLDAGPRSTRTKNAAWGLGLSNVPASSSSTGTISRIDPRPPVERGGGNAGGLVRRPAGWRRRRHRARFGVGARVPKRCSTPPCRALNPDKAPSIGWFKTQKGRGYGKLLDAGEATVRPGPGTARSSGPIAGSSWTVTESSSSASTVLRQATAGGDAREEEAANLRIVMSVLRNDEALVNWLSPIA